MRLIFLALLSVVSFSCATHSLVRDGDYAPSLALYKQSEFSEALNRFPKKEEHGFITSVEKAWLSLWNKTGDNSELEKQIKSLDQRRYISVSQEAEFFFFNETADGYIPAEHEIVALHLINAMIYMQQKKWEDAEVEARRASYFLQNIFNSDQPHFDDPSLRLWLAGVWMSLNNWDAAQVDLRRVYAMTYDLSIRKLIEMKKPPAFFRLFLNGSGPELKWNDTSVTPDFVVWAPGKSTFVTSPWYERHMKRNTAIRDTVLKSNYMAQYAGIKANSGTQKALGQTFGNASRLLGVTLGAAIIVGGIYALSAAGSTANTGESIGYVFAAGGLVIKELWQAGDNIIDSTNSGAKAYEQHEFEKLRIYRFVRFLPNQFDFEIKKESEQEKMNRLSLTRPQSLTDVEFILNP